MRCVSQRQRRVKIDPGMTRPAIMLRAAVKVIGQRSVGRFDNGERERIAVDDDVIRF
jgi:hypothetical protein